MNTVLYFYIGVVVVTHFARMMDKIANSKSDNDRVGSTLFNLTIILWSVILVMILILK